MLMMKNTVLEHISVCSSLGPRTDCWKREEGCNHQKTLCRNRRQAGKACLSSNQDRKIGEENYGAGNKEWYFIVL